MRLRVLKTFKDMTLPAWNNQRNPGQEFEVDEIRAEELLLNPYNIVEKIDGPATVNVSPTTIEPIESDTTPPLKTPEAFKRTANKPKKRESKVVRKSGK